MGDLIILAQHRAAHAARCGSRLGTGADPVFWFDLSCPFTYLAAERVQRALPHAHWRPALGEVLSGGEPTRPLATLEPVRRVVERRAAALRLPLVWRDRAPRGTLAAMRAAAYAAEQGEAADFVLAASRLAWCGAFDLDDPVLLAEAAAAARLSPDACVQAAYSPARDRALQDATRALRDAGADRLPALTLGARMFCGERRLAEAAALARAPGVGSVVPFAG